MKDKNKTWIVFDEKKENEEKQENKKRNFVIWSIFNVFFYNWKLFLDFTETKIIGVVFKGN